MDTKKKKKMGMCLFLDGKTFTVIQFMLQIFCQNIQEVKITIEEMARLVETKLAFIYQEFVKTNPQEPSSLTCF